MANINATAIVSAVKETNGKAALTFESVKTGDDGKPTFSFIMKMAADHPAVAQMPKESVVSLTFAPTGAVQLAAPKPQLIVVPDPEPEINLAPAEKAPQTEWKGGAAVTSPALINPDVNELKRALGIAGGSVSSTTPTQADAWSSERSQYAGDK